MSILSGYANLHKGSHYTRNLNSVQHYIVLSSHTLSLLSALLYRILLFKNVLQTGFFSRPINAMTGAQIIIAYIHHLQILILHINSILVIDETIKLVGFAFWQMISLMAIMTPFPPYEYTGENFCQITQWIATMGITHSFIGGFGIAFMRMLFIRFPNKLKIGETATSMVISIATVLSTTGLTYIQCNSISAMLNLIFTLVK